MELILAFHRSLSVPASCSIVAGNGIKVEDESWTGRDLAAAIERYCTNAGVGARVCALLNQARGLVIPPHEKVSQHFDAGDKVVILGDISPTLFPERSIPSASTKPQEKVPITILTGFLGAGKTTVLNHLLKGQSDKKIAVIENEFGAVPIDQLLLQNDVMGLAEQVVVMSNGCMCCTVRGDILGAFDSIRKQMEIGNRLDAVLIETTGMADPVPIVRTLKQTPDIARYFKLDGTVTLVDSKSILNRLEDCEGEEDHERHRQIAFADVILLNKVDLVRDAEALEVWNRLRSYNDKAKIVACVKGILPPSEIMGLNAFEVDEIVAEFEDHGKAAGHGGSGHGHKDHGHSNGRGHDHDHDGEHGHDHDHAHDHDHGHDQDHGGHGDHGHEHDVDGHGHDHDHDDGHAHDHDHDHEHDGHGHAHGPHDKEIGSFSIEREGHEVDLIEFERWVRVISTLSPCCGKLYRSKGVLAVLGSSTKLIFHAVADVCDIAEGPTWATNEPRVSKIVFIGKRLDIGTITNRFLQVMRPCTTNLRGPLQMSLRTDSTPRKELRAGPQSRNGALTLIDLARYGLVHRALICCWSSDVYRLAQTCPLLHDALFAPEAHDLFKCAAADLPPGQFGKAKGLHAVKGQLWLHALLPMRSISIYAQAYKKSRVTLATSFHIDYMEGQPMQFDDIEDVKAAGVTWMELAEFTEAQSENFVCEFGWRDETMTKFFDDYPAFTHSRLVELTVKDPVDCHNDDDFKFRLLLKPLQNEETGMSYHEMSLQLVGGKSSSKIYLMSFQTIESLYQVHIPVPDSRTPMHDIQEMFHRWHPLMAELRRRPRIRFLVRMQSREKGPMESMCGCCP